MLLYTAALKPSTTIGTLSGATVGSSISGTFTGPHDGPRDLLETSPMTDISKIWAKVSDSGRRLIKGAILVSWIYVLFQLAVLSWSQGASEILEELRFSNIVEDLRFDAQFDAPVNELRDAVDALEPEDYAQAAELLEKVVAGLEGESSAQPAQGEDDEHEYESPIDEYAYFLDDEYYEDHPAPPVIAVVSELIQDPSWTNGQNFLDRLQEETPNVHETDEELKNGLHKLYQELFNRIEERLRGIVDDRNVDSDDIGINADMIIPFFRQNPSTDGADSQEIKSWVDRDRNRIDSVNAREELVDTFILLIVLGAFGSMIFLTRDYIEIDREMETSVAAYVFRPLLGIFLAIAMFVIDILLHSVISTAEMTQVRMEPLYLLAFASGLLSEQAYGAVHARAQKALADYQEANE